MDVPQHFSRRPLAQSVKTIYTATCRLEERRFFARGPRPRPLLDAPLETEPTPGTHREQPDRPSQRPSPRRLVCVRVCRLAGHARPAVWAGACASRLRGSLPAGRPLRLNDAPGRSLNSRGPDSAKDPGLFVFSFTSGVPLHSDVASTPGVRDAGCARRETRIVQRDAASDGRARVGAQPKWKPSSRVRLTGKDSGVSFRVCGFDPRTRHQQPEVAGALTLRDANRPQRLGGSGTRHRNLFLDVAKWSKAPDCKSAGKCPRRFDSDRRVQCFVR